MKIDDKKKKIIIIVTVVLVSIILLGSLIHFFFIKDDGTTYTLRVPNNITSIVINKVEISNKRAFEDVKDIFSEKITTRIASIQDFPVNYDEILTINLNDTVIYAYKRNKYYYYEQPYNGMYLITKKDYLRLKEALN